MRISRILLLALIPVLTVAVLVFVVTVGITTPPFRSAGEAAIGKLENSFGDQYRLDANSLSSEWTFTRDAQVVLNFERGSLSFADTVLEPGCYSGIAHEGDVLTIHDGHRVSFTSPETDSSCKALP